MENLLEELKQVVEHNEKIMDECDGDQNQAAKNGLIEFEFEGTMIYNPFYESSYRFEVDPIEEYGIENIKLMINKYKG